MSPFTSCLRSFALGAVIAAAGASVTSRVLPAALADATGYASGQSFAVATGLLEREDEGCVWVVEPERKRVACYVCDRNEGIRLVGVRKFEYDLQVVQYRDLTPAPYTVPELVQAQKKYEQRSKPADAEGK